MTYTAVSLFAGVGGIDEALKRAGIRVTAAVEIDHAARGVLHDRHLDTTLFTDVREVTADELLATGFVPHRGVLAAGWPCTDLSVAGRREGLAGARSGLFWQIVRLAAGLRPRWLLLENVPGLLSSTCPCPGGPDAVCGTPCGDGPHQMRGGSCGPGRCMDLHGGDMGTVLGSLAELGYGFAYRVLDAQHFGVPQRRRRVVIVGCLGDWAAPVEVLLEPEGCGGDSAPGRAAGPGVTRVAALSASNGGADDNDATGGRLIAGPLQAAGADGRGHRVDAEGAANGHLVLAPTLTRHHGRNTPDQETFVPVAFDLAQITSAENRVNPQPGDPAMPLAATGQPHVAYALRAEPGGDGNSHNTTFVPLGGEGVDHALTAEGHDASEDGTGRGTPLVAVAYQCQGSNVGEAGTLRSGNGAVTGGVPFVSQTAVRRLTPTECERLQGFPDGWTATSWGKPQSDSARYRQLGNSVAVPVFVWVARRLVAVRGGLTAESEVAA